VSVVNAIAGKERLDFRSALLIQQQCVERQPHSHFTDEHLLTTLQNVDD
jgi:hypothetical protein